MNPVEREEKVLKEIIRILAHNKGWPEPFLPCDYLILDTETTGFSSVSDRIVSVGFCAVKDCKINHELYDGNTSNVILKWPSSVFVGAEKAIEVHGIDYVKSQEVGVDPIEAMTLINDTIKWALDQDMFIVGHNFIKFDSAFIEQEMSRAGIRHSFDINNVIDTHVFCKAMQLGILPGVGESITSYAHRVNDIRAKGIFSNLDRYCVERFDLKSKYNVNPEEAHDSGYDCYLTHLVLREINKIAGYVYKEM